MTTAESLVILGLSERARAPSRASGCGALDAARAHDRAAFTAMLRHRMDAGPQRPEAAPTPGDDARVEATLPPDASERTPQTPEEAERSATSVRRRTARRGPPGDRGRALRYRPDGCYGGCGGSIRGSSCRGRGSCGTGCRRSQCLHAAGPHRGGGKQRYGARAGRGRRRGCPRHHRRSAIRRHGTIAGIKPRRDDAAPARKRHGGGPSTQRAQRARTSCRRAVDRGDRRGPRRRRRSSARGSPIAHRAARW